jgi:hypothetical protein
MEKGEEWNVNVVVWSSVHGGLEMMWLEFRDWKLLRCLTAVAPQLRHSLEIATLEPSIHSFIHSFILHRPFTCEYHSSFVYPL